MSDERPFLGAKLILFLGDDLIVLRRDHTPGISWPGRLDFPGGGREDSETPEACAIRETHEEVGLDVGVSDLVWSYAHRTGGGVNWFYAAELPQTRVDEVRFGGEGEGWELMSSSDFLAAQDAIPHFQRILRRYLDER